MPDCRTEEHDIDLSVLFISFNRSDLLEISFRSLRERADLCGLRVEFVVSDDASQEPHAVRVRVLPFDIHVSESVNKGLGHNCNKGLRAARGAYILQIQDDCEYVGTPAAVLQAVQILREDEEIGIVQLTRQTPNVPHVVRHLGDGTRYVVFTNDGVAKRRPSGSRPYSDQPHLKRREFCDAIGPYREGVPMTVMELDYQQRVACQNRWRVACTDRSTDFTHIGAARSYNPGVLRAKRREQLERYPIVGPLSRAMRLQARRIRNWVAGVDA